jgi:predicted flavoprotein YhiN
MAFLADFVSEDQRSKANAFVGMQIGVAFMLSLLIGPMITVNLGISGPSILQKSHHYLVRLCQQPHEQYRWNWLPPRCR